MKKFTLMMIAMLVSVVSMAGTPKKNFAPSNAVKSMLKPGFLQKKVDLGAERVSLKGKTSFKEAFRTVSDEPTVTPNELILASQYSYDELYGGMIIDYPVEVAYYVISDNNIILQLNDLLVLEGTIAIEEGNEVVTFKTGEVVATKTSTGEELVLKCCDWDTQNYVLVPNNDPITGFIFRDDAGNVTDIYIPVLQAQDETLTNMIGVVGSVSGVVMGGANYDMVAEASGRTWVAKVTGKDFPETQGSSELTPFENEAKAFIYQQNEDGSLDVLINGINNWYPKSYTCVTWSADGTTANIANKQNIGHFSWSQGQIAGAEALAVNVAYLFNGTNYTPVEAGTQLTVSETDNGTLMTSNDNDGIYMVLLIFNEAFDKEYSGIYNQSAELNILVTNEESAISTGIKEVNTTNNPLKSNAATYNLAGQKVGKDFKGIVVRDGKKFMVK